MTGRDSSTLKFVDRLFQTHILSIPCTWPIVLYSTIGRLSHNYATGTLANVGDYWY